MAKKKAKSGGTRSAVIAMVSVLLIIAALCCAVFYQKNGYIGPQEFTYPVKYEEYVIKYSNKYNVDPAVVYSVIKTESGFDEKAVSNVGARGLMQLMEDAYNWVKYRLGDEGEEDFAQMFDPEKNIEYGTYYLSYLLDKYGGSVEIAAAAYHCGMGTVDNWLENGTIDENNFDADSIPDENDQTRHYVKKIAKAYKNYKIILKEE
ncbi:MAG: lytic transglycosylase domain-containing protein [Ruminococcus sp.]|nr:lytic transglycosylase domain-containing protein [Ruminococcus sp.]